jgi:DNA-binding MarR family transcriptional regulator
MSRADRNDAILKAYHDGFMQSEIARYLKLTGAGVSKILKKLRVAR